jgi:hypothetical protein
MRIWSCAAVQREEGKSTGRAHSLPEGRALPSGRECYLESSPLKVTSHLSIHLNIRYQGSGGASSGEGGASVSQYSAAMVGRSEFAGCHHHRR